MKWVSNTRIPKKGERSTVAQHIGQTQSEAEAEHAEWLSDKIIGPVQVPVNSSATIEELIADGLVGVYLP